MNPSRMEEYILWWRSRISFILRDTSAVSPNSHVGVAGNSMSCLQSWCNPATTNSLRNLVRAPNALPSSANPSVSFLTACLVLRLLALSLWWSNKESTTSVVATPARTISLWMRHRLVSFVFWYVLSLRKTSLLHSGTWSRRSEKTFWLPDFTNVKRYIAKHWLPCRPNRSPLLVARQEEIVALGNPATAYYTRQTLSCSTRKHY